MKKSKQDIDALLMREACQELNQFTEDFFDSRCAIDACKPETLFWIAVKYAEAHKRFKMGPNKKGQPF